jgi:hypothetical protein
VISEKRGKGKIGCIPAFMYFINYYVYDSFGYVKGHIMKYIVVLLLLCICSGNSKREIVTEDTTTTEAYSNVYDSLAQYYDSVKIVVEEKLKMDKSLILK